jgi:hypothetical protein
MTKRFRVFYIQSQSYGHRVSTQFSFRTLQRPWCMMNFPENDPAWFQSGVQGVSFSEPMIESSRRGVIDG